MRDLKSELPPTVSLLTHQQACDELVCAGDSTNVFGGGCGNSGPGGVASVYKITHNTSSKKALF
jgi:hypothetical protein